MHLLIFGHSFSVLVATILLPGLAFHFLNKKKARVPGNAEDADTGASGPSIASMETNSVGSSPYPTETNDGGSSSLIALTENCYEVLLSFRGLDTRHGFTDHLYNGLLGAGIDVFRDNDELRQGENIRPELLAAITKSKILIPILSENYGTSGWCLDELVQIMECKKNTGKIVLPVFYKVKPADVRHQIGSFGDAFRERERRSRVRSSFDPTISEKWKKALDEVSTLKGYEADGYEGELVKLIVQKVLSELKKEFELVIPENLVGIDGHVEKVMKLVDNNSSATLFVGICGMGGIGKTTLAKTIYNKLSNQFEYRSFIADIRESCRRSGLDYLQNQLISDVLRQNNQVSNKDDGIKFISSKFKDKKVLILVDDVDDHDQLKALVGNHNWFSSGSRILITTRNSSILDNVRVDHKYEHEEMDENQSMILFSRHAFWRSSPPSKFEDLARDVIITTGGLPLSLEVLGSFLCGKEPTFWRATIDKLKKVPHKKVREKLRISYEELDDGQKQIFLDIACFFIGTDRRIVSYMWDASGFFPGEGIEVLRFMSLIKIGDDHRLRMHDQLRDLGREIVCEENQREPQYRSRLWDSEEVQKVLKKNKGTDKIEAISLSEGRLEGFDEVAKQDGKELKFKDLTSLRFLQVKRAYINGHFKDSIEELRWLHWKNRPLKIEVKNFHAKKLAILELSWRGLDEKWEGWSCFKMAENLKFLDLSSSYSLENTDFLSAFKNLEVLILNKCFSLQRIDSSIGDMKALLRLELGGCARLRELPTEIGKLKALERLLLSYSLSLSALPDSIGSMENLEILNISHSGIRELPDGIRGLTKLQELKASFCKRMRVEWEGGTSFKTAEKLKFLDLSSCHFLENTDFLSAFKNLEVLILNDCRSLQQIDSSIGDMKALLRLELNACWALEELPFEIGKLKTLEKLLLSDTPALFALPDNIGSLENLEILDISSSGIEELPNSIGRLRKLRALIAVSCENLRGEMPESMSNLSSLRCLDFCLCTKLQSLPGLPSSLTYLRITYSSHKLPSLSHLTNLKELRVQDCGLLKCIQVLPSKLPESPNTPFKLETLEVCGCGSIETLDVSQFMNLTTLSTRNCSSILEVRGLDKLIYLETLTINSCGFKRLDLPKFECLKTLEVRDCNDLVGIRGLDGLEFLQSLNISGCISIESLLLPKSRTMKVLDASFCRNLAKIQEIDRLECLEVLCIKQCTSIERLDLSKSRRLKELDAGDCENLVEIQGLDRLVFLEKLRIIGCKSLKVDLELHRSCIY